MNSSRLLRTFVFVFSLLGLGSVSAVEYKTLVSTASGDSETITLQDGDIAEILGKENIKPDQSIVLEGPCSIRIRGNSYSNSARWVKMNIFYNIIPKEKEAPSKKFATVIPENASTNIRVILEQSTDLINWTAASPGVFPPSTAKRFFRVRSEEE